MASPQVTQVTTCGATTATASTSNFNFSDAGTQIICVVAHASNLSSNPTDLTISDTQGLSWVLRASENIGNQGGFSARQAFFIWTAETGGPLTTTITITGGNSQGKEAVCFGMRDLHDPSAPFDDEGIASQFTASGAPTLTFSTQQANDLLTAFAMAISDPGNSLSPAGFSGLASVDEGDGFSFIRAFNKSVSAIQSGAAVTSPNSVAGYMILVPFTADGTTTPPEDAVAGSAAILVGL